MPDLFRKTALDKISSPEQLDKAITIISPAFWIAAVGAGAIVAVALIWSVAGRLPVNVNASGIYMGQAGLGTVVAETSGIVDEVYVKEGDYVEDGQEIAHLDAENSEKDLATLRERRESVEAVTFTSTDDVLTADNKPLMDIKAQRILSGNNLVTDKAMLEAKQKELEEQNGKTEKAKAAYESARSSYLGSMNVPNTSSAQMGLQNAQSDLASKKSDVASVESALSEAQNNSAKLSEQQVQLQNAMNESINAFNAAQQTMAEAQAAMTQAQTAQQNAQTAQQQAQLQMNTAAQEQAAAAAAMAAAEAEPDEAARAAAVQAAQAAMDQANQNYAAAEAAFNQASAQIEEAVSAYNQNMQVYEASSNESAQLQQTLSEYQTSIDTVSSQLADSVAAVTEVENSLYGLYDQLNAAQVNYNNAEYNYVSAMGSTAAQQSASGQAGTLYNAAYQEYNTELAAQRNLETTISQLKAQVKADEENLEKQNETLKAQFDSARAGTLSQLDLEIAEKEKAITTNTIRANNNGYVASINVMSGNAVQAGSTVCRISTDEDNEQAIVCYVPVSSGRKIRTGMNVIVYPSTVNRQEYGHMEGEVTDVSNYVSSAEEMSNQLGDSSLVQAFQQMGPVVKVVCSLEEDDSTVSGYKWSSKKGAEVEVADGTMISADIVVEEKSPISMVIPLLKEKFTIRRDTAEEGQG